MARVRIALVVLLSLSFLTGPIGLPASADEELSPPPFFYRVTSGASTQALEALVDGRTATAFYDYFDSSSHTGYELSQTVSIFLWSGPEGKSLVFMMDAEDDGSGGSFKVTMSGLPTGSNWLVKDDPTGDVYTTTSATWSWAACCTDGGVMSLNTNDAISITLNFPTRTGLSVFRLFGGPAESPEFVTFDPAQPLVITTFQTPDGPLLAAAPGPGVGQVRLNATPPLDDGGDPITSYRFYQENALGTYDFVGESTDGDFVVTGLDNGVAYSFIARAVNKGGAGDASAPTMATTFDVPSAPVGLAAIASQTDAGHVALTWAAPVSDGGIPLSHYQIHRDGVFLLNTTATNHTDANLTDGTSYVYRVRAVNAVGAGPFAADAVATTIEPPAAPLNVTVVPGPGPGALTVTWDAPSGDGGAPILGFRVERGGVDLGDRSSAFVDAGLAEDTFYVYAVYARNAAGEGEPGIGGGTTFARPSAPADVNVSTPLLRGALNVTWSAPTSDGGLAVTEYRVYRDGSLVAALGTLAFNDIGLADGNQYLYEISAVNAVGEGPLSLAASGTTADVPDMPVGLVVASGSALGSTDLSWAPPADVHGAPVLLYTVYAGPDPGNMTAIAEVAGTSYTHVPDGIPLPVATHYAVSATNVVGEGLLTEASCGVPMPYGPAASILCA